jgi:hypothetical protein
VKIIQVNIDPNDPSTLKGARVDLARVDATTEEEIQAQIEADDKEAMMPPEIKYHKPSILNYCSLSKTRSYTASRVF